jgi:hypothetical protein
MWAAALILQDRLDQGLSTIDAAIDRFIEAGGRTGVVVFRAARAAGLAAAGRIEAAVDAVAAAYRELGTYGERFAEPLVLEADARMRHARGDDPAEVAAVLAHATRWPENRARTALPAGSPRRSGWACPRRTEATSTRRRVIRPARPLLRSST